MNEQLLTMSETAAMLRVGDWTVRNWMKQNKFIPPYRIGGRFMFRESDVLAFIKANYQGEAVNNE